MTTTEAYDLMEQKFTVSDSVHAPKVLDKDMKVSEEFIKFCIDKGYLERVQS